MSRTTRNMATDRRRVIRAKLWALQGGCCCYCATRFENCHPTGPLYPTIEHIKNRCDGGVNAQDNLALACRRCNERAGNERWSEAFKRAKLRSANIIDLADLEIEHMELPPVYLAQAGCRA